MRPALRFVDTHAHLHSTAARLQISVPELLSTMNAFLAKEHCELAAVVNVFCESEQLVPSHPSHEVLSDPRVFSSFGLHPHEASRWSDELERNLRQCLAENKSVAVGECGLDYHYMSSPRDQQLEAFRAQCRVAVETGLPLVVHSREAEEDTMEMLEKEMPREWHIHVHCFTSSPSMATRLLAHFPNLFIGFTGVVTFKKNDEILAAVAAVPLDRILLETDAPYMAPTPHRGKICHSGHALLTARRLCELKGAEPEQGFEQLCQNAAKMYKLKL